MRKTRTTLDPAQADIDDDDVDDDDGPSTSAPAPVRKPATKRTARTAGEEAEPDYEELDGEQVMAFNMRDERDSGFDDATGVMRGKDDEDVDPWLDSIQHDVVCAPRP